MRLTRITLAFVVLIFGIGFYRLSEFLIAGAESQSLRAAEEAMVDTAHLLATGVAQAEDGPDFLRTIFFGTDKQAVSAQIFSHTKNELGLHAYLTDAEGVIVFDSAVPGRVGDNLGAMRDIALTLKGRYGARSSMDPQVDVTEPVMYVGAPVRRDETIIGCLSVYKSQADLRPFIQERKRTIILIIILFGVGLFLLVGAVFIWLFRPIGQLTRYAREVSEGARLPRPNVGLGREVNTLANALHDMREALEGRQYVERYVQTLTHELKSPLAAIKGASELIDEDMPVKDRAHFLNNIKTQTERCQDLIHQLLELSALESQSHLETRSIIDWDALFSQAVSAVSPMAETAGVHLNSDKTSSPSVSGNERLLLSALIHLLENAIQFSPRDGTVILSLTTGDQMAMITVVDEGEGIPDFAAERAFERFYSFREGARMASKGNGLGLAFVQEVAFLHHGEATISACENGGTLARLSLPLAV